MLLIWTVIVPCIYGYVTSRSDYVSALYNSNGGGWGSWGQARYCNYGHYGVGFRLKVEAPIDGDDTAGNSFSLLCDDSELIAASNAGPWGSWSSTASCPSDEYIVGYRSRVEGSIGGGDDTAFNSVIILCSDGTTLQPSNGGPWGSWTGSYDECPADSYVCGFRIKVESPISGDDTAMNALQLYCCSAPTDNPTNDPTQSPTFKNCEDYGEIKNINWNNLQNNGNNSSEIPYNYLNMSLNEDTLQLAFDLHLEYLGLSTDPVSSQNDLGTAYIVDFKGFETNGDFIDKPGNCQNRLNSSFNGTTNFNDFWTFRYVYLSLLLKLIVTSIYFYVLY